MKLMDRDGLVLSADDVRKRLGEGGGRAFPVRVQVEENEFISYNGMSLRSWLAGQALPTLAAYLDLTPKEVADRALAIANAVIEASE